MNQFTNEEIKLLSDAVTAASSNTIVYAFPMQALTLTNMGYLESNEAMRDPEGRVAFRPTAAGLVALQNLAAANSAPPVPPVTVEQRTAAIAASHPGFARVSGFQVPTRSKRASKNVGKKYDLESLELYGAIFVPATAEQPNPKKSLASTISSANRKYATFQPPRFFKTFSAEKGQSFGEGIIAPDNGVYIVRLEPPAPTAEAPAA